MTEAAKNKLRSMLIMEEYFGYEIPNSSRQFIPITNFPKHIQKAFEELGKIVKEKQKNKIHLN